MDNYSDKAIKCTIEGDITFCKFLSANDTGATGGHQSGIYVPKNSYSILFDREGSNGENMDRWEQIRWQDEFDTNSRFIYYGQGTRDEYRITNFGRDFPFLKPEFTGALFILIKNSDANYMGFILNDEDGINSFLDTFGLDITETNKIIDIKSENLDQREQQEFDHFIASLDEEFPSTEQMSAEARRIQDLLYNHSEFIVSNPDSKLIDWTNEEYRLFRALELSRYGKIISDGFNSVEDFITIANKVLNRRKSRAGKSLESHLSAIFSGNNIDFESQIITEGRKRPDFLFPSEQAYRDASYPSNKLVTLAAKTTCKDRWRQILNEADRLRDEKKYLCTLQQGISPDQMDEMENTRVILVVPKPYIKYYPANRQNRIWTIKKFIEFVRELEES